MEIMYLIIAMIGIVLPTISYLFWVKNVFGRYPTSYSGTYRMWEEKYNKGFIFTAWTGIESIFLIFTLSHYSDTIFQLVIAIICPLMLALVGLYPTSIDKDTTKLHCIFAKLCATSAIVWLLCKEFYAVVGILVAIGLIWSYFKKDYETLIMEMMAFLGAYIGIIISYLN